MVKVLVLFYSTYGHIYQMAKAVVEGVKEVEGVEVELQRVKETLSDEILTKMHALEAQKQFADVPIADPHKFGDYHAVILGFPTRFGAAPAQMKTYIDAAVGVWASNAAVGHVGSCFTSSATQHGGQETTLQSMNTSLLHFGFIIVGLPYSCSIQNGLEEIKGGSPYGATTIAGNKGERLPSEQELSMARFQGKHVADIARRLFRDAK
eukprot:TRINITY_DN459_c0_g1_i1.p1 TRINITY_DN459_c0_g1~~TRINITY_DN459_c0_g1_i1.p1  ORF type:complete len:208 (-),score=46.51 TRINITY_DN459_c0_g1_i1:30-653(-)